MSDEESAGASEAKRHPVMLRLAPSQMQKLRRVAQQRDVPLATLARQLMWERLEQLNGHGR